MLRFCAIAACAALCLPVVQGAEPQNTMPPALLEAIAGQEPYASLVELGLPLLNATEEVEALPAELRAARATAIKRVLLEQMLRARDEQHRISSENYAACARLARELEAPEVFVLYLQLEAEGQLAPRARYAVREAMRRLCEDYRVDSLALRYFVEGSHLAADDLRAAAEWLPLEGLFNHTKTSELTPQKMEADYALVLLLVAEMGDVLAGVQTREQADAAVGKLLPLLAPYVATSATRNLAHSPQLQRVQERYASQLQLVFPPFAAQRRRLREANYLDSIPLRVFDSLLD